MNLKMLMACAATITCLAGTSLTIEAAESTSSKAVQSETTSHKEYKVGEIAPDLYKQERVGIKDWQKKGLKAPQENSQWVQISNKYALIETDSGKILDIAPAKK
ncbi:MULTISPECIES: RcnB family protein [unclassified Pseudomonas]|uniref:RcnB family protein n=1 Tax=unclassified Pseudomonas TaxID=196821 RepID=UPI0025CC3DB1|nr:MULTISPECIES: RcnB family protein [unclassified Pseudomonas]